MTTPDYRALCAEFVEARRPTPYDNCSSDVLERIDEIADRARALLAAPEAVGVGEGRGQTLPPRLVAERLPAVEDCNADERCWIHQPSEVSPEAPSWVLLHRKYASENYMATHWLPHWALPLPGSQ